tara:strand:- start:1017 stop:1532 length:516 start_codon:yes stop_codon:yes gene_type:complete
MTNRLDYYSAEELTHIVTRSSNLLATEIEPGGALEIASRARGTPRVANSLLRWVRDYAQVKAKGIITATIADQALAMIDIDDDGLDEMDKRILESVIYKFDGGPVGLSSLSVATGEDASTIEEVYEPYLIMQGMLARTPRGRVAMKKAYLKIGATPPQDKGNAESELNLGN